MKPNAMHAVAHRGCHDCAPKGWRAVPNVTGDYDFDATIMHRGNKDMARRLAQYVAVPRGMPYSPRTYHGNHGNHGDD